MAGLPEGLLNLVLVGGGLLLGLLLSPVWVGLPLLAGTGRLALRLAERERRQANRLLDAHLPPVPVPPGERKLSWRRLMEESEGGRVLARRRRCCCCGCPTALAGLVFAGAARAAGARRSPALGVSGLAGDPGRYVGPWALGPAHRARCCACSRCPRRSWRIAALEGAGAGLRALALRLLRSRMPEGGPVRELLAERLGDRSLNIAYWLPEREIFVDDRGRPVQLPEPGSGRTWTAVEREGARVAAIVHDAELDATPELVTAAASAAALAIDNERLKAELRARVEELRVSRLRIVEAADDARRRIERDLHDGAQQQLVSLALDLRMLKARLGDSGLADDRGHAGREARRRARRAARAGPRHPPGDPVRARASARPSRRSWPARRWTSRSTSSSTSGLPAPVEAAAYFVIAEGLTNVVRYAETRNAARAGRRALGGEVQVVVSRRRRRRRDVDAGTGLRGLTDRLAVLDGRLRLASPLGEGTRLEARIP